VLETVVSSSKLIIAVVVSLESSRHIGELKRFSKSN